jgi:hypothetical protein
MNLYTELALYKVNIVSVTSTDSWNSLTNKLEALRLRKPTISTEWQPLFTICAALTSSFSTQNILASLDSDYNSSWKKTCRLSPKALHALLQFHTLFTQL